MVETSAARGGIFKLLMLVALTAAATALVGCGKEADDDPQPPAPPTVPVEDPDTAGEDPDAGASFTDPLQTSFALAPEDHAWWMEKASRTIRGFGLSPKEKADWSSLTRQDITAKLVASEAFAVKTIQFGLHYFGVPRDKIVTAQGKFIPEIFHYPAVISAAQAVKTGGDFLQILAFETPLLLSALNPPQVPDDPDNPDAPPPPAEELRARYKQKAFADVQAINTYLASGSFDKETACGMIFNFEDGALVPFFGDSVFDFYGAPTAFTDQLSRSEEWFKGLLVYCFFPSATDVELVKRFQKVEQRLPALFQALDATMATASATGMAQLQAIDLQALGLAQPMPFTSQGLFIKLPNSSTNYNRKRAAFVLKRYFCDDLTPVDIVAPEGHSGDAHASEPSCQACHYKLDPMAGFFKNHGLFGEDFSSGTEIVFDDGAQIDIATYEEAWRADADDREWNIGYVRSASDPALNAYGESLGDLYAIIQEAPEVKQCLVKRMFEYYVADDQVIDGAYLEFLATAFVREAAKNSTQAYKNAVQRLVLSQAFAQRDPQSKVCYDRPENRTENGVPCAVTYILEKNCASCHSASSAAGGLDLTTWVLDGDGAGSFRHLQAGKQLGAADSFAAIFDRLTTTDATRRMPYNMHMPTADRDQLYLWVYATLNGKESE